MIAKHVPMRSAAKSDFVGLVNYITDQQSKEHRLGDVRITNCETNNLRAATAEVLATQLGNTRASNDKTYHLLLSFRAGESPSKQTLHAIEDRICAGLGFGEHQRISAVHNDTDNLHIHIAINKIHPKRGTIHEPYKAYKTLAQLCELLEGEFGLQKDNHTPTRTLSEGRAADMEKHAGIESLMTWIKTECLPELNKAGNWEELQNALSKNGLALKVQGNGFVLEAEDGTKVKASSVSRGLSKPQLEKRFGEFSPSTDNRNLRDWINKEIVNDMHFAHGWQSMHQLMRKSGLTLREQSGKLIIEADGCDDRIEADAVSPLISRSRLEKKLGAFQPMPKHLEGSVYDYGKRYQADSNPFRNSSKKYRKRPVKQRINTVELYAKYKEEQAARAEIRKAEFTKIQRERDRRIADAKRNNKLRRKTIALVDARGINKRLLYSQASASLKSAIAAINSDYLKSKAKLTHAYPRRTWADWLRDEAQDGNQKALEALRAREAAEGLKGNTIQATQSGFKKMGKKASLSLDGITKKGTIIYRSGRNAIRDDGDKLQVSRGANLEGLEAALKLAMERFGGKLAINGTAEFKAQVIHIATKSQLSISFTDPSLEKMRQQYATKEQSHEQPIRRRPNSSGSRVTGSRSSSDYNERGSTSNDGRRGAGLQPGLRKPNIKPIGRNPPPESQNRLRGLSELGVVHIASGSEVLLPSNVSGDMEQQKAQPAHGVRRDVHRSGPGIREEHVAAAHKYIAEREKKRLIGFDIPNHYLYNGESGALSLAGLRKVDGFDMALLKDEAGAIGVHPIDKANAQRLTRVKLGEPVTLTNKGIKRAKGRSR